MYTEVVKCLQLFQMRIAHFKVSATVYICTYVLSMIGSKHQKFQVSKMADFVKLQQPAQTAPDGDAIAE